MTDDMKSLEAAKAIIAADDQAAHDRTMTPDDKRMAEIQAQIEVATPGEFVTVRIKNLRWLLARDRKAKVEVERLEGIVEQYKDVKGDFVCECCGESLCSILEDITDSYAREVPPQEQPDEG